MATATRANGRATGDRLYRLRAWQYRKMVEAGILTEADPVVLLDGLLVTKMTKGERHVMATKLCVRALERVLPAGWHVGKEDPVELTDGPGGVDSEPEPDAAVIRDYPDRKPGAADVALVVEVADTSLREDRAQLARYAWAAFPIAWIVNLNARSVEVYTRPTGPDADPRYQYSATLGADADAPVIVDGREVGRIRVADILP